MWRTASTSLVIRLRSRVFLLWTPPLNLVSSLLSPVPISQRAVSENFKPRFTFLTLRFTITMTSASRLSWAISTQAFLFSQVEPWVEVEMSVQEVRPTKMVPIRKKIHSMESRLLPPERLMVPQLDLLLLVLEVPLLMAPPCS